MAEPHLPTGRRVWRLEFKDQYGKKRTVSLRVRDERVAKTLSHQIQEDAERLRAGMPPKNFDVTAGFLGLGHNKFAPAPKWSEALDLFIGEVGRRTDAGKKQTSYMTNLRLRLRRMAKECGWKQLNEVTPSAFMAFLADLARKGSAPATQNCYLAYLQRFMEFCVQQRWLTQSPITNVEPVRVGQAGRRRLRRPFTLLELERLCSAASERRSLVYRVAAYSGFRRIELSRLRKEDCMPTGEHPRWQVDAQHTKNRQAVNLPMAPECAEALRSHWQSLPPGSLLFPPYLGDTHRKEKGVPSYFMFRHDRRTAGILHRDERGRYVDFHSLRYTFCKLLSAIYPIEVVSRFMRHSNIQLTVSIYLDLGLDREGDGQWTMPRLTPSRSPTAFPTAEGKTA